MTIKNGIFWETDADKKAKEEAAGREPADVMREATSSKGSGELTLMQGGDDMEGIKGRE